MIVQSATVNRALAASLVSWIAPLNRPSPHLDGRVHLALRGTTLSPPPYTGCATAALGLLPEDCYPLIHRLTPEQWRCHLGLGSRRAGVTATSGTLPLAVTAAALLYWSTQP